MVKCQLIEADRHIHDSLLPLYIRLYSIMTDRFSIYQAAMSGDGFWPVHSTLHMWPLEMGRLDRHTFKMMEDWFVVSMKILATIGIVHEN